jgi:branched-chain amino acid transport system ATP-binding protein
MAVLKVENIHTYYGKIHALDGISLQVNEGEIVCLIGANGAGKTTILKTICGLLKPAEGSIHFGQEDLTRLPPHQIIRRGIALVPEGRRVFARMSTQENLEMGAFTRNDRQAIQQEIERMFVLFPRLKERRRQLAGTLSGGEQQMLAIARALMVKPVVLLMDEPSMGLSPILLESIFATILEINRQGTTVLLVEQNTMVTLEVAHRGYVIQTGRIVHADTAAGLRTNAMVQKAYLGITQ